MKKARILLFLSVFSLGLTTHAQTSAATGEEREESSKHALKNLSIDERNDMISKARVFNEQDPASELNSTSASTVDVIQDLQERCGPAFQYRPSADGETYEWPTVSCEYHQDDHSLGGATTKFYCDFPDNSKKSGLRKRKVKYPNPEKYNSVVKSEIFPSILAATTAHLLGFYTELYCPAKVICKNCPSSNPWSIERSSGPAKPGNQIRFDWTIVENPLPYKPMTNPQPTPSPKNPQGLNWDELVMVKADNESLSRQMRIEREAWMLWVNFILDTDSYSFNQRLSCVKPEKDASGKTQCLSPIVYTHDYGHAFFERFQFNTWNNLEPLVSDHDGVCRGQLSNAIFVKERHVNLHSLHLQPAISSEARDLLVQRLQRITDRQWKDIFQLSRVSTETSVSTAKWIQSLHKKIDQLKSAHCQPFDAGLSVLANQRP